MITRQCSIVFMTANFTYSKKNISIQKQDLEKRPCGGGFKIRYHLFLSPHSFSHSNHKSIVHEGPNHVLSLIPQPMLVGATAGGLLAQIPY